MSNTKDRLEWFREARFGMFIHWGLYALPAGTWNGIDTPWVSEWIMRKMKIPANEYANLAKKFNPVGFDARTWVKLAKEAGMKYMVITAKHHDGFAMFHSRISPYNIVDATPFGRDPLAELAAACGEAGMKLGFYYSQDQDWHEPGGSGNDWDTNSRTTFAEYLENKVKPQLRELLTNYGKVCLIWFDTPYSINEQQSRELKEFVHAIQPDCLVSGRVGHDLGDYGSLGDNVIPAEIPEGVWEGVGTTNDSWGYKANDRQWKSSRQLLRIMAELISKGANYLLNVGPDALGRIPEAARARLLEVGGWLRDNGEAVYGTGPSPFRYESSWGRITVRDNKLYLWLFERPESDLLLYGLRNKVSKASVLLSGQILDFAEQHMSVPDYHKLSIVLPEKKSGNLPEILAVETQGMIEVNEKSYDAADF